MEELKLEGLIEKIKREGVEEAKRKAGEIISQAKQEAGQLIQAAGDQAAKTTKTAEKEAAAFQAAGQTALSQAARDLVLVLKEQLTAVLDRAFQGDIAALLTPQFLKELIIKIVDNWSPQKEASLQVLLGRQDQKELERLLRSYFKQTAKKTVEIKIDPDLGQGFRIGVKGEEVFYDFTAEAVGEALKQFLNPALAALLTQVNE